MCWYILEEKKEDWDCTAPLHSGMSSAVQRLLSKVAGSPRRAPSPACLVASNTAVTGKQDVAQ